ncbi:hypothetical protein Aph02nite_03040 [Actinoplanes philippinensis]|uniref:Uncharacterized protein n=1 Tax=Actinoplanes philippinensis TaxID=35752 RepID=A0A1I2DB10_9ACTN|nr:hypothetical protein [Actinoplanes philippinensis]GIE74354.1 hypothetical protein Aph02nite_03040 [Actinoplanes philippinensis]SFE77742.1 hypothetical protein SAMN05421541_103525 [Actinoplanes philippinensis]
MTQHQRRHPASWWTQFQEASERFDTAYLTEGLGDLITPKISSPLLRREAEIATDVVVRHLNKPQADELADRARKSTERLIETVTRLEERSGDGFSLVEAHALCHLLEGRFGEAAHACEEFIKTQQVLRIFVGAMRLERFDADLAVKMLAAGHQPAAAMHSGLVVGKYSWWPSWLITIVTERAMDGHLDKETVEALDRCAYAELTPAQSRIARRLLAGEDALIDASAVRLEGLGEMDAAEKLRKGDLTAVALAARLIPV